MDNSFCKYKNILGEPYKGFHKERFLGLALYDVIGTILIGIVISKVFNFDLFKTYILLILFTIFIHRLFCVETAFNKLIF
jgi:hypothetical protein